jgi:hypothetical protein
MVSHLFNTTQRSYWLSKYGISSQQMQAIALTQNLGEMVQLLPAFGCPRITAMTFFLPRAESNFASANPASPLDILENGRVKTRTLPPMFERIREKGTYASAPAATYASSPYTLTVSGS